MDMSFWTGAVGAGTMQKHLDVVSNNLANINTNGYKAKDGSFQELVKYNLHAPEDEESDLRTGSGARIVSTHTDFTTSAFTDTNRNLDFAINGDNRFFGLQDPTTGRLTFTRDGRFHAGQMGEGNFYLMNESNQLVLNSNGQPIPMDTNAAGEADLADGQKVGVFTVTYPSRLLSAGDNAFAIQDGDNENTVSLDPDTKLTRGALETSGTDMAKEMTKVIETERAMQMNLRMVSTSDEVMQTINQLRG
jgi:flagellar basal-body rod protein FlgG